MANGQCLPRIKAQQTDAVFFNVQMHGTHLRLFRLSRLLDLRQGRRLSCDRDALVLLLDAQLTAKRIAARRTLEIAPDALILHIPLAGTLCLAAAFFANEHEVLLFDQRAFHVTDIIRLKRDASVKLRVGAILHEGGKALLGVELSEHERRQNTVVERTVMVERTVVRTHHFGRLRETQLLLTVRAEHLFHIDLHIRVGSEEGDRAHTAEITAVFEQRQNIRGAPGGDNAVARPALKAAHDLQKRHGVGQIIVRDARQIRDDGADPLAHLRLNKAGKPVNNIQFLIELDSAELDDLVDISVETLGIRAVPLQIQNNYIHVTRSRSLNQF